MRSGSASRRIVRVPGVAIENSCSVRQALTKANEAGDQCAHSPMTAPARLLARLDKQRTA